jgi:5-methylcytosine-specific restriction endonuclease McrA
LLNKHKNFARKALSKQQRQNIYNALNGRCAYCGCEISLKEMQADHIVPIRYIESGLATVDEVVADDNLVAACRSCNHRKNSLTVEQFRLAIEHQLDVLQRDSVTYRNAVRFGQIVPNPHPIVFYFETLNEKSGEF